MAFGEDHDLQGEQFSDAGGDPSGFRAALEEVRQQRLNTPAQPENSPVEVLTPDELLQQIEEKAPENCKVSVALTPFDWSELLTILGWQLNVVNGFDRDQVADLFEDIASQLHDKRVAVQRHWHKPPKDDITLEDVRPPKKWWQRWLK